MDSLRSWSNSVVSYTVMAFKSAQNSCPLKRSRKNDLLILTHLQNRKTLNISLMTVKISSIKCIIFKAGLIWSKRSLLIVSPFPTCLYLLNKTKISRPWSYGRIAFIPQHQRPKQSTKFHPSHYTDVSQSGSQIEDDTVKADRETKETSLEASPFFQSYQFT